MTIAVRKLQEAGISYSYVVTEPPLGRSKLMKEDLYVLRQCKSTENHCELILAARIVPSYL